MLGNSTYFLPEALILDIPEIDEQHQNLFADLADIKVICVAENCLPEASAEVLIQTLLTHFETEERLAKTAGYDFSLHAIKHETMIQAIRRGITKVKNGEKDVFSLLKYVEYWFERHIAEEDVPLGRQISKHI